MKIEDAVNSGIKFFKKKTTFGPSYMEFVEVLSVVRVKNLLTGNIIKLDGDYDIQPIKDKPSDDKMNKENSYRSVGKKPAGKKKSSEPSLNDILVANLSKIKSKDDLKKILKANGVTIGSNTIRYAWFKKNQIIKKGGK